MTKEEALEWFNGKRSMANMVQQVPEETFEERVARADAAKTEQAYWVLKACNERLIPWSM